jgi:hypothetical protein
MIAKRSPKTEREIAIVRGLANVSELRDFEKFIFETITGKRVQSLSSLRKPKAPSVSPVLELFTQFLWVHFLRRRPHRFGSVSQREWLKLHFYLSTSVTFASTVEHSCPGG